MHILTSDIRPWCTKKDYELPAASARAALERGSADAYIYRTIAKAQLKNLVPDHEGSHDRDVAIGLQLLLTGRTIEKMIKAAESNCCCARAS